MRTVGEIIADMMLLERASWRIMPLTRARRRLKWMRKRKRIVAHELHHLVQQA